MFNSIQEISINKKFYLGLLLLILFGFPPLGSFLAGAWFYFYVGKIHLISGGYVYVLGAFFAHFIFFTFFVIFVRRVLFKFVGVALFLTVSFLLLSNSGVAGIFVFWPLVIYFSYFFVLLLLSSFPNGKFSHIAMLILLLVLMFLQGFYFYLTLQQSRKHALPLFLIEEAFQNKDPDICANLDPLYQDTCIKKLSAVVSFEKLIEACDKLPDGGAMFAQHKEGRRDYCRLQAINKKDPKSCEVLRVPEHINQCYEMVAVENTDESLCQKLSTEIKIGPTILRCVQSVRYRLREKDPKLCELRESQYDKNACYEDVAFKNKDESLCQKLPAAGATPGPNVSRCIQSIRSRP